MKDLCYVHLLFIYSVDHVEFYTFEVTLFQGSIIRVFSNKPNN